jgi:hypothetical protein
MGAMYQKKPTKKTLRVIVDKYRVELMLPVVGEVSKKSFQQISRKIKRWAREFRISKKPEHYLKHQRRWGCLGKHLSRQLYQIIKQACQEGQAINWMTVRDWTRALVHGTDNELVKADCVGVMFNRTWVSRFLSKFEFNPKMSTGKKEGYVLQEWEFQWLPEHEQEAKRIAHFQVCISVGQVQLKHYFHNHFSIIASRIKHLS